MFFQKCWSLVGGEITELALKALNTGTLDHSLNSTNIVLIPKTKNPVKMQDLRPISLCNVVMKIITKCLANRLKLILPNIISRQQSGFVPGRLISDNILVAQEVIHYMQHTQAKKVGCMSVKLDLSKAYDRVEWGFLESIMHKMGFGKIWIDRVMLCIRSVSYKVKLNGNESQTFYPSRGLRQGDPISPFLFLICGEGFIDLINKAVEARTWEGLKIVPQAPAVSSLFFADDSLLFMKAKQQSVLELKKTLNLLEKGTGEMINFSKSEITFSRYVPDVFKDFVRAELGMQILEKHTKYLGVQFLSGQKLTEVFSSIEQKISARTQGWKESFMSQASREILIKSVLLAQPQYAMSTCLFPRSVLERMMSHIVKFWWASGKKDRGIHWTKREVLTRAKEDGGMGIRDLEAMNYALLARQGWRILNNTELLVSQIYKAKYFPNTTIWQAQKGSSSSKGWSSIYSSLDILREGVQLCNNEYKWIKSSNGDFSTSSAYQVAKDLLDKKNNVNQGSTSSNQATQQLWKRIWKNNLPPKIKLFAWRCFHGSVADDTSLARRGLVDAKGCCWCGLKKTTANHIFFQCWWAKVFWRELGLDCLGNCDAAQQLSEVIWLCHETLQEKKFLLAMSGLWCIWLNMNKNLFEGENKAPKEATESLINFIHSYDRANSSLWIEELQSRVQWHRPAPGTYKINCDAALFSPNKGHIAAVVRDFDGVVVACWAANILRFKGVAELESRAVEASLALAHYLGIQRVEVESDCLEVVAMILKGLPYYSEWHEWIGRSRRWMETHPQWRVYHIMREFNTVAHTLAREPDILITQDRASQAIPWNIGAAVKQDLQLSM